MSRVKRTKKKSAKPANQSKPLTQKRPVHVTAVRPDTPASEMFARVRIDNEPTPPIKQTGSWRFFPVSTRLWIQNYDVAIALLMLPVLVLVLGSVLANDLQNISNKTLAGVLLLALGGIWMVLNIPAGYYFQLQAVQGNRPRVKECYRQSWRFVPRLIGLIGLVSVLTFGGLLLLIFPGIIVIRRYILSPFYLLDQDLGIREAMARSAADSKPVALYIWGIYAAYITVNIFCILLFSPIFPPYGSIIGAFVTSLFVFGPALRYREVGLRQSVLSHDPSQPSAKDAA